LSTALPAGDEEVLQVHEALQVLAQAEPRLARWWRCAVSQAFLKPRLRRSRGRRSAPCAADWDKARLLLRVCAAGSRRRQGSRQGSRQGRPKRRRRLTTAEGQACLIDFGIAKRLDGGAEDAQRLTQEQGRVPTPHHATTEQMRGDAVGAAADVHSLEVLLYWLLTGRLPHAPARPQHAVVAGRGHPECRGAPPASQSTQDPAVAQALRGDLDTVLAKALRKRAELRHVNADALAADQPMRKCLLMRARMGQQHLPMALYDHDFVARNFSPAAGPTRPRRCWLQRRRLRPPAAPATARSKRAVHLPCSRR
jgi:hypothetical protein